MNKDSNMTILLRTTYISMVHHIMKGILSTKYITMMTKCIPNSTQLKGSSTSPLISTVPQEVTIISIDHTRLVPGSPARSNMLILKLNQMSKVMINRSIKVQHSPNKVAF